MNFLQTNYQLKWHRSEKLCAPHFPFNYQIKVKYTNKHAPNPPSSVNVVRQMNAMIEAQTEGQR